MPEEKLKLIQDTPSRYHFKTKDDQRVSIEHKDRQLVLGLYKWGEEASLELALNMVLSNKHQFLENGVEMETPALRLRAFPIDIRSTGEFYGDSDDVAQCEDGGLRFKLVLKAKPLANFFTIPIKAKNLRFSKQPFLTQEDIDAGVRCPLNVEGSYAVYHVSKKNNQYMTGKAFHLYRPIAEDALGNKAWCAIHIDGYIDPKNLTITVPQQFLDEAVYSVTIDPDFGYTAIGGATSWLAQPPATDTRLGSAWAMPANGTANYIKAYLSSSATDTVDCKAFINQRDSGGASTHGQIAGPVENLACAAAAHWEEFTLDSEALTQAVNYILNIMGKGSDCSKGEDYNVAKDTNGAVDSYVEQGTYDTPESPWVIDSMATTIDYSIYCNYSEPVTVVSGSVFGNREAERGSILVNRDTERPGVLSNIESPGGSIFSNVESERSGIRSNRA